MYYIHMYGCGGGGLRASRERGCLLGQCRVVVRLQTGWINKVGPGCTIIVAIIRTHTVLYHGARCFLAAAAGCWKSIIFPITSNALAFCILSHAWCSFYICYMHDMQIFMLHRRYANACALSLHVVFSHDCRKIKL
jgi:type IV secretory pathway VirB3-like protein